MTRTSDAEQAQRAGCSIGQLMALRGTEGRPARDFQHQRHGAYRRGVEWKLTLWEWWTIWNESGRYAQRGRGQGYVMCRRGDVGPYAVGNVFIAPAIENGAFTSNKLSTWPIGVTMHGKRFRAKRIWNGQCFHLGMHDTPELAHKAYLSLGPIGMERTA